MSPRSSHLEQPTDSPVISAEVLRIIAEDANSPATPSCHSLSPSPKSNHLNMKKNNNKNNLDQSDNEEDEAAAIIVVPRARLACFKRPQHSNPQKQSQQPLNNRRKTENKVQNSQALLNTTTSSPDYERPSYRGFQELSSTDANEIKSIDEEEEEEEFFDSSAAAKTEEEEEEVIAAEVSPVVESTIVETLPSPSISPILTPTMIQDIAPVVEEQPSPSLSEVHYNRPNRSCNTDDYIQEHLFSNKPAYVANYGYEIVQNLFKSQKPLSTAILESDRELLMHENLIDLMSVMHSRLNLSKETYYLAANLFTSYMGIAWKKSTPSNSTLIVLVATSLFISAKYEEIYAPPLSNYKEVLASYVSELAANSMLECEGAILTTLDFQLFGPTRLRFLEAYLSQTILDDSQKNFCYYLLELSQLNHALYKYNHSEIAAATILLSEKFKNISGRYFWSHNLEILTNYKQRDLYACVDDLYAYLVHVSSSRQCLHIFQKYSEPLFNSVSLIDYDLSHNVNTPTSSTNSNGCSANSSNNSNGNNANACNGNSMNMDAYSAASNSSSLTTMNADSPKNTARVNSPMTATALTSSSSSSYTANYDEMGAYSSGSNYNRQQSKIQMYQHSIQPQQLNYGNYNDENNQNTHTSRKSQQTHLQQHSHLTHRIQKQKMYNNNNNNNTNNNYQQNYEHKNNQKRHQDMGGKRSSYSKQQQQQQQQQYMHHNKLNDITRYYSNRQINQNNNNNNNNNNY